MTVKEAKAIAKDHERLKENLTKIRKQIGIKAIAAAVGISKQAWNYRMRNNLNLFGYDDFKAISRVSGIPVEEIEHGVLDLNGGKK